MATQDEALRATNKAIVAIGELLETVKAVPGADGRALAVARTQFETALLWVATAVDGGGVLDA